MHEKILSKKTVTEQSPAALTATPPDPVQVQARIADAAARALAEAAARRAAPNPALPPERGGRNGPEPTRYGDWEKKGIICDF